MATYQNITAEEMADFLTEKGFLPLTLEGTTELVFGRRCDKGNHKLSLRVYTGILPEGDSRAVGEDAIRVTLFIMVNGKPVKLAGSKRVHRVQGWKANLQKRLDNWQIPTIELCRKCGMPMAIRETKKKPVRRFLGCTRWPDCKETRSIEPDQPLLKGQSPT